MSCRAQLLPAGTATQAHRATSSTVYFVIAGDGASVIDGIRFEWNRGDVFVVPNWCWHEHVAGSGDCYLFSVTDEPTMTMLGLYREQAYPDNGGRQDVKTTFAG